MTVNKNNKLTEAQIGEIIFMALSDDVSFDSINERFGIDSDQIKRIMKQNISFGSYKKWRERVKKFSKRTRHLTTLLVNLVAKKFNSQRAKSRSLI